MKQLAFDAPTRGTTSRQFWLTPPELYEQLDAEFHFDFDPCPFPRQGFDGLTSDWGDVNFVNPPFLKQDGGLTPWLRKGLAEYKRGRTVVFLLPQHQTMAEILSVAEIRNLGKVKWVATDGSGKAMAKDHTIEVILRPRKVAP